MKKNKQKQNKMIRYIIVGFGGCFLLPGLLIMIVGIKGMYKGLISQNWKKCNAIVQSSEIINRETKNEEDDVTFKPYITYKYTIDENDFIGDILKFGKIETGNNSRENYYLKKYPVDKCIIIYYNSSNPSESVIEPGLSGDSYFLPIFGLIFSIVGGCVVYVGFDITKL